jgi:hypothetical protein
MSQSCLHTACTVLGPLLTFLGFFAPSQGTPTSPQERFNAPVLKTKMAPRGIVAFLLDPRTEPNKTEAFRIKKWQQTGNGKRRNGLLPKCCQIPARPCRRRSTVRRFAQSKRALRPCTTRFVACGPLRKSLSRPTPIAPPANHFIVRCSTAVDWKNHNH